MVELPRTPNNCNHQKPSIGRRATSGNTPWISVSGSFHDLLNVLLTSVNPLLIFLNLRSHKSSGASRLSIPA
eukprot:3468175-Amphidinium_carterae.1